MRIKPKFLIFAVLGMAICGCAQQGADAQSAPVAVESEIQANWQVDKSESRLEFTASQGGEDFKGEFSQFDARIQFDPEDLENANVSVSIDMTSVDAGDSERNEALPGKEWFSTKVFPIATFTSNTFKKSGDNKYEAEGELTIRDVSRSLVLPFELKIENDAATMTGSVDINRTDYEVGTGMWKGEDWVAHPVEIHIKMRAEKLN